MTPDLQSTVSQLRGIGPAKQKALASIGIFTLSDLLHHYPRTYENRGAIRLLTRAVGEEHRCAFLLTVTSEPHTAEIRRGLSITKFRACDESATAEIVYFNQPYVRNIFHIGATFRFWGQLRTNGKHLQLSAPAYELYQPDVPLPDLLPVYPLTEGITNRQMLSWTDELLQLVSTIPEILPYFIIKDNNLCTLSYAYQNIHRPQSEEALASAIRRLTFDELLCLGLGVALSKRMLNAQRIRAIPKTDIRPLTDRLPYQLTEAQKRVVNEIYRDMTHAGPDGTCAPMHRILIGDVGSGKTICAAIAVYLALKNGFQAALMVPTEILALQHYRDMEPLFNSLGFPCYLLTGSTPAKEKNRIYRALSDSDALPALVIGTHALLSDKVSFHNLGLTVTDEQHRFGVLQRAALKNKTDTAHLLVMSATPIPRTLALALYGDLSISLIDQMPAGRQRVDTYVVDESYRERLYAFIRKQVSQGGQVYIVCPSIEESDPENISPDAPQLKDATGYADTLTHKVFPDLRIALIHGRMPTKEKDAVMKAFSDGTVDILVSTTVIEVGVNVPNASLMVVENAERFGLAQLHQLRGRVGRGQRRSYCILVSEAHTGTAHDRLEVLRTTYDGFRVAEQDLAQRGPGDFFAGTTADGVRQSGGLPLQLARLCSDTETMQQAFRSAERLLAEDPRLESEESAPIKKEVERLFAIQESTVS